IRSPQYPIQCHWPRVGKNTTYQQNMVKLDIIQGFGGHASTGATGRTFAGSIIGRVDIGT
ncbi:MAG: hypothetical protein NXI22_21510, partial [bacterium]|nr:hypothetical protein [bacterium]